MIQQTSVVFAHTLTNADVLRYSRQILVEDFGPEVEFVLSCQQKLQNASLLIIGSGALASPIILYCAAAGFGRIGIADSAKVSQPNLTEDIINYEVFGGQYKVESAALSVKRINGSVVVETYCEKVGKENSFDIIGSYDCIVNCTNEFSASCLINEVCKLLKKPLISGTVNVKGGKLFVTTKSESSSFDCCSPLEDFDDFKDITTQHIIGPAFGIIGCLMAVEVVKVVAAVGFREKSIWKTVECATCKRMQSCRDFTLDSVVLEENQTLAKSSLLIVGAGGLGSPVALYCAAAGIGRIGVVDHDVVSIDNLHRQIVHNEAALGQSKVDSLKKSLSNLNAKVIVEIHNVLLTRENAKQIIDQYDVIADCSDNVVTRYLVSDVCAMRQTKKPVVSGSALGWNGQLTVYNFKLNQICFRCLHPEPIPVACAANCADNGVIGPVVGVIGSLQACEVLKILLGHTPSYAGKLFAYDGVNGWSRDFVLRTKKKDCFSCSITNDVNQFPDYDKFCSLKADDKVKSLDLIALSERLLPEEVCEIFGEAGSSKPYLIDTRPSHQFRIGHFQNAINIPYELLVKMDATQIMRSLNATTDSLMSRGDTFALDVTHSYKGNASLNTKSRRLLTGLPQ